MSFSGRRVLALESRRAKETAELIRRNGGEPFVAPSMRELPLESNEEAFRFAERLFAGEFDCVIFLTGVGVKYLMRVLATRWPEDRLLDALSSVTVVARGPKPTAALREINVPVTLTVPEPNTWRELLAATEGRPERRIAIQLYGRPPQELLDGLRARGAKVTPVPVYAWALPEDVQPLREAVAGLASGAFAVTLFTTSVQVVHLLQIADEMGLSQPVHEGLRRSVIGSIGPTTTETLLEYGLKPDLEPTHPKLGFLMKETAERWAEILRSRKGA